MVTVSVFNLYPVVLGDVTNFELPLEYSIPFLEWKLFYLIYAQLIISLDINTYSCKAHPFYEMNYMMIFGQTSVVAIIFIGLDGIFIIHVAYALNSSDIVMLYIDRIPEY